MSNQQEPENLAFDNEHSLQTLVRTITLSQETFSLILLRCNYADLRHRMVERLRQLSPVHIREITLPSSVKTLYTNIREQLGDEQPPALMIFGLESVKDINTVLTSANQVREEFRKNFPFPILLWVNDSVLQKFIRLATDLENWATIIKFENPTDELVNFLQQKSDEIFAGNVTPNPQMCRELETARQDLQNRGEVLEVALQASLEFLLGLNDYLHDEIDSALAHYQQSLGFWRQSNYLERQGILLVNIASVYNRQAEKNQTENQRYWQESKNYLQQAIETFELAQRSDLVAKHITKLGEVLRHLQAWSELQSLVEKSLPLHQNYGTPLQLAKDYGFLAEVALEQSRWDEAHQLAGQALQILANIPNLQSDEFGLYRFILAKSQQGLGQYKVAINSLKAAKFEKNHQYNPQLYISILERLRLLYFKQGGYLDAFNIKQEQLQIEQQYGFRAFVGASYLNPQRQAINSAQLQVENPETIAQEIAASGRGQDVNRLRERIAGTEYKLTVIHGQSGVGKSSILQGGLIPALQQQAIGERDALPILLRVYTDWVGMLGQSLAKAFEEVRGNQLSVNLDSSSAILEQLRRNADRNLLTVLMFDQFGEFFFVYPDQSQRRAFYEFLQICLDIPFVKIILSLREDYLHYLLEFDRQFNLTTINNNILDKNIRYYLGNFSPADAKAVVESLTERSHFYLEPELIDRLVQDLAGDLGEIRPIELQIVGTQLQTEKITTLEKYLQSGTKEKLVERFLEEVIKDCGSENELCARVVLYLLTDEKGTRPFKTADDLAEDLKTVDIVSKTEQLNLVLEILVGSGLVLNIPEDPAELYQLVHDYLVSFIRQSQEARELEKRKNEKQKLQQAEEKLNILLKRQRNLAIAGGAMMTFLATVSVIFGFQAENQRKQSDIFGFQAENQRKQSEKNRIIAISKTSEALFTSHQTFDALKESIYAGILLKKLPFAQSDSQIRTQVVTALQQSVNWIVERNRLEGHQALIWGVTFSHNGKLIASTSYDHTIKLWNLDGSVYKTLEGHQDKVLSVSFSPDDQTIVSGDFQGVVKRWKQDGKPLKDLEEHGNKAHSKGVYGIDFSRDGQTIATGSRDGTVKLWKPDGTWLKTIFNAHKDGVNSVAFSPDNKMIATGGRDKTVKLWTHDGKFIHTIIKDYQDSVWNVAWSSDSQRIAAAAGRDKRIRIWKPDGIIKTIKDAHKDGINSVAFSPNGNMIATASDDKTVKLWNRDGKLLTTLPGHTNGVYAVRFSPDCKTLVSASADGTMKLWTIDSMVCSREAKTHTSASADSTMKIQFGTGVVSIINAHSDRVNKVHFLPDDKMIASASDDKTVKLWKRDGTFKILDKDSNNVSFSRDGQTIVAASDDKTVKLWKRDDGKFKKTLFNNRDQILDLNLSPNGKFIALGSMDNKVIILRLDSIKPQIFDKHHDWVRAVAWSPDSQILASASDDNTVQLWKQDNKGEFHWHNSLAGENGHKSWVLSVSFSPNGQMIATSSNDKTVILWKQDDKGKFRWYKKLEGHTDQVNSVTFSPNGDKIATASDDKTVKLWTRDGNLITTLTGHSDYLLSVTFSADGKTLALGSVDGAIILWNLDKLDLKNLNLDSLLRRGCDWLHDYLHNQPEKPNEIDRHLCDDIK
ncbi:nSTAND1 domain-containing NTPase [Nostoc sp.]|uniref:nSTAND1 domain-containing NTPase n=1 Tax=Nostoc sp. TaxID=1180 RepID=UPI002FF9BE85